MKRAMILTGLAVLAASGLATAATSVTRITDPARDLPAAGRSGHVDIVAATSRQDGDGLVHTVTMRSPVDGRPAGETPQVILDPDERPDHGDSYLIFRKRIVRLEGDGGEAVVGRATQAFDRRTWTFRFATDAVPDLDERYTWYVVVDTQGTGDVAPGRGPLPAQSVAE